MTPDKVWRDSARIEAKVICAKKWSIMEVVERIMIFGLVSLENPCPRVESLELSQQRMPANVTVKLSKQS